MKLMIDDNSDIKWGVLKYWIYFSCFVILLINMFKYYSINILYGNINSSIGRVVKTPDFDVEVRGSTPAWYCKEKWYKIISF